MVSIDINVRSTVSVTTDQRFPSQWRTDLSPTAQPSVDDVNESALSVDVTGLVTVIHSCPCHRRRMPLWPAAQTSSVEIGAIAFTLPTGSGVEAFVQVVWGLD
jgi:hypothetical protein